MMGVCPQFDMLFDNLTSWEHMRITNWMKRPRDQMSNEELAERLDDVKLTKVAHQMTKTYSGGMKRRLSVVLSTVGNPRVIFMDEPSTGMDPGNRRYVWDLVRKIKDGKLIVLVRLPLLCPLWPHHADDCADDPLNGGGGHAR
jgi:ABC-type multidrug transport system ATPase subunit